jgi:hypothetical protein
VLHRKLLELHADPLERTAMFFTVVHAEDSRLDDVIKRGALPGVHAR